MSRRVASNNCATSNLLEFPSCSTGLLESLFFFVIDLLENLLRTIARFKEVEREIIKSDARRPNRALLRFWPKQNNRVLILLSWSVREFRANYQLGHLYNSYSSKDHIILFTHIRAHGRNLEVILRFSRLFDLVSLSLSRFRIHIYIILKYSSWIHGVSLRKTNFLL